MRSQISSSAEIAIKPFVVPFTGPLIRVATQATAYPPGVKIAILPALAVVLERIPNHVEQFFSQLNGRLSSPSAIRRVSSCGCAWYVDAQSTACGSDGHGAHRGCTREQGGDRSELRVGTVSRRTGRSGARRATKSGRPVSNWYTKHFAERTKVRPGFHSVISISRVRCVYRSLRTGECEPRRVLVEEPTVARQVGFAFLSRDDTSFSHPS